MRRLLATGLRFGLTGGLTVAFYFVFLWLLRGMIADTATLTAVCYVLSMGLNYVLQSSVTFRARIADSGAVLRYVVMHAICMGINSGTMTLLVDGAGIGLFPAQMATTVLVAGTSFLLSYFWVYNHRPH